MRRIQISNNKKTGTFRVDTGLDDTPAYDGRLRHMSISQRGYINHRVDMLLKEIWRDIHETGDISDDVFHVSTVASLWRNRTPRKPDPLGAVLSEDGGGGEPMSRCTLIGTPEGRPMPFNRIAYITRPGRENRTHARIFVSRGNLVSFGAILDLPGYYPDVFCAAAYVIDGFVPVPPSFRHDIHDRVQDLQERANRPGDDAVHIRRQARTLREQRLCTVNLTFAAVRFVFPDEEDEIVASDRDAEGNPVHETDALLEATLEKLKEISTEADHVVPYGMVKPKDRFHHFVRAHTWEHIEIDLPDFMEEFKYQATSYRAAIHDAGEREKAKHHGRVGMVLRLKETGEVVLEGHLNRPFAGTPDVTMALPYILETSLAPEETDLGPLTGSPLVAFMTDGDALRAHIRETSPSVTADPVLEIPLLTIY